MKKIISLLLLFVAFSLYGQQQTVSYSVNPSTFDETANIILTFEGSSINEATWGVTNNALYLWAWSFDINDSNIMDSPTNGSWTNSNEANRLSYNTGSDTYTISFAPTTFYNRTDIGRIGFLIKAKDGTGNKKSQDILVEVGNFQVTLTTPDESSTTILNSNGSLNISATNTNGNANYNLKANGISINTNVSTSNYSFNATNITSNQNYALEVTQTGTTITKNFAVIINPGSNIQSIPPFLVEGINYDNSDDTKVTLVLDAPLKDFVYIAGSFNDWQPDTSYAMKKDPSSTKFWLELTGLTSGQIETYQYWVFDTNPIANSPSLVKTADPFSTLVLSPFDDPFIPASTYPNLPVYPAGQEREVTVLKTGQTPYNWQVPNFAPPKEEDLIVYEVLIRDFDASRNYQDLIDRIDYFKNLNINAIQLMPVMEYEGNESWGYNTAFHMALDKFYGTENKFKEFIDLCHQNDIAVILDVALNHAFGRNPMVRMWMNDPDGDGWGGPSSENPYFNQVPKHSYNVGSDFNHQNSLTQEYTRRVVKHWIEDFKIDGFRWDLTKGFTQNCENDENCTNSYQQDRVDILKTYADYSWLLDANHYVIFEHLGAQNEEKEWANYRLSEGKGIMMWGKMTDPYSQLLMGYSSNSNIDGIGHNSRSQFNGPRLIGYPESHDEERIMYRAVTFGNESNGSHNVKDLNTALSRMSAIGAVSLTIPGPKMIWHFGALGMENSIFTCSDGSINDDGCKLDTKPQPQWTENWLGDTNRKQIYDDWARLNELKINEAVFEGDYAMTSGNLTPRIDIFDTSIPTTELRNVIVLANFDVVSQTINTNFPTGGNWYDLMDNTGNTTYSAATVNIPAGQFRIFGNAAVTLSTNEFNTDDAFSIYPNPSRTAFSVNANVSNIEIYNLTGKLVKSFNGGFTRSDSFDIASLHSGIYLVKVENDNNQTLTTKLVKL